jgi:hypothetical protein
LDVEGEWILWVIVQILYDVLLSLLG